MDAFRLTSIESAIARLSDDPPDFLLLRNRYPELSFFFDRYEHICDVLEETSRAHEELTRELDSAKDDCQTLLSELTKARKQV